MANYSSSIANVFKALRSALVRQGVNVGGTASYPRVEIHSVVEDSPIDKGYVLRSVTCTIECVSDEKVADVVDLARGNISRIFSAAGISMSDYREVGVVPGQIRLFQEQEALDQSKVIYRLLQDVTIWVQKI